MKEKEKIQVLWTDINLFKGKEDDYISLTDIARYKNPLEPKDVVSNWLRLRNTIDYMGLRERINNPNFKGVEFDPFQREAWSNAFTLSPSKWIEKTWAIWLVSRPGNGWWTFAHKDIAIKFASWISVEFELYLNKEFQRLKEQEHHAMDRNVKRFLTKMNYRIHTDAIQDHLIPDALTEWQKSHIYADEADVLNMALFGQTAKQRREASPSESWNMRDEATIEQLIVLANLESINAELIRQSLSQSQRIMILNQTAITQMKSLIQSQSMQKLT